MNAADLKVSVRNAGRQPPMRIAVVTETYPPEVNGVAATLVRVVDGLRERQHQVQLVRPRQAGDADPGDPALQMLLRGLPIPRYPHLRLGLPARRALRTLWSAQAPDLVHIATEGPLGWSALRAALQLGLPVTSDFRTNFHTYSQHYGLGWLQQPIAGYLRHFHNRTACTMVPTDALRRELQAGGYQRTATVARGVDTIAFSPAFRSEALRRAWGAAPTDTVVLCVGRLAPEKNLDTLLLAFDAMQAVNRHLHLVLVGDGPERAKLAARCPGAVFSGQRAGDDLAAHYASADLFLFPSLTETFGNVTPEALASGLPVLAYDHAAAAQLVQPGVNGALVCPHDAAGFVRQAVAWAADPRAARSMGAAARRTALSLEWGRIVSQIEAVFRSAMAEHHHDHPASLSRRFMCDVSRGGGS